MSKERENEQLTDRREANNRTVSTRILDSELIGHLVESGRFDQVSNRPFDDLRLTTYLGTEIIELPLQEGAVIALTGGPASGKTTISDQLLRMLRMGGHTAESVSTDDFLLYGKAERNGRIVAGLDPLFARDFTVLDQVVTAVREGRGIRAPRYDNRTGDALVVGKDNFPHEIPPHLRYLLVEGDFQPVHSPDLRIYLHLPTPDRKVNRIERDMAIRGGTDSRGIATNFDFRWPQFLQYTLPHAFDADIIVVAQKQPVGDKSDYSHRVFKRKNITTPIPSRPLKTR